MVSQCIDIHLQVSLILAEIFAVVLFVQILQMKMHFQSQQADPVCTIVYFDSPFLSRLNLVQEET